MNKEIKAPVLVAIVVVVVAAFGIWIFKSVANAGSLDQGQVKYTPGVPPWKENDPSKRGPGAAAGNGPPGVGAPIIGNSG